MQRDIKYHFLSFWYDSTQDWTPVSRAIVVITIQVYCNDESNKNFKDESKFLYKLIIILIDNASYKK